MYRDSKNSSCTSYDHEFEKDFLEAMYILKKIYRKNEHKYPLTLIEYANSLKKKLIYSRVVRNSQTRVEEHKSKSHKELFPGANPHFTNEIVYIFLSFLFEMYIKSKKCSTNMI